MSFGRSASKTSQIVWSGRSGWAVRFRPGKAFVEEPGVQFVIALESQPRREEAFAHGADLVLDLALLPARRRGAGDGLDKMMRAHLEKAAIVLAVLADEDRLHRRLHIVVHAARTRAFEERERPFVGVEHHLLRLARIGADEHHAAVAEADVRDLHDRRHPVHHDDLVAPVELVGLARRECQRDKGGGRRAGVRLRPAPRIATDRVISAFVAGRPQLLENPDERQPLASRRLGVRRQQPIEFPFPSSQLRARLHLALIGKRRVVRPQNFPNRIAGKLQGAGDLPDRLTLDKMLAPYPTDRLHNQHPPPPASRQSGHPIKPENGGSILDADTPP